MIVFDSDVTMEVANPVLILLDVKGVAFEIKAIVTQERAIPISGQDHYKFKIKELNQF